ncbi:Glycosyl hydrolase family 109 protein 1 precursor [Anaerohalosphaera lusitana]|uniref:Glycosyl hydrolase family 109 protein 1 n=1 Tax=Anaerohalosphaera lusitana TaxID=1936003 RepID=A0A1U9NPS6_9BACT|nr:Gfo/Idh/MocA family oxidoreductase [Anaerohalosphaera lusitana]AQT69516.1 Glycosyl hydrolase family 109 protein 1 precursor [Anaerohalosphaera lusitana]
MARSINRRDFLRSSAVTGAGAVLGGIALGGCSGAPMLTTKPRVLTTEPKDEIRIGFVGIGNMGSGHVRRLMHIPGSKIAAVCDIRPSRTKWAVEQAKSAGLEVPAVYGKDETDFVRMCENEDLDLVYNAAPWEWHTPICLAAMENGSHAASEVNIALSIEDCWKLVETAEKTKKHCVMMENCCYDKAEMAVMNMVGQKLFGDLVHGECGYLHDLRGLLISDTYYQGQWRWKEQTTRDGNLYPTHGIGPMAWCMDINRGDTFDYMVSVSSRALGLHQYVVEKLGADHPMAKTDVACGDVNIALIRTKKGKTIICKHDTHLPRPYSRDFLVQGTKGIMRKYPKSRVHIEGKSKGHGWEDFGSYLKEYEHPVWKATQERIAKAGSGGMGHGGMDYIEDYRLIQALRRGISPDIDVYDSVLWSSVIPVSEESVRKQGEPVKFPDFTRGMWKKERKLGIVEYPSL